MVMVGICTLSLVCVFPLPSLHFPEAGSWWRDPPPLTSVDSPWDVAEISAWQKHLEEQTTLSPLDVETKDLLQKEEDPELEAIKAKVREMEQEEWLQELQAKSLLLSSDSGLAFHRMTEEKVEADQRSIYVGNVDYGGTAEQLESHFNNCGKINRVTILCDKFSGHPKGYAYIEFADKSSVKVAMELDESVFRDRVIKVGGVSPDRVAKRILLNPQRILLNPTKINGLVVRLSIRVPYPFAISPCTYKGWKEI
uniref:PABPN1 like, cytoplasmic n=1 Tax=Anolis carolinensis TaxID=28377 RepID=H9GJS6_ANOCA